MSEDVKSQAPFGRAEKVARLVVYIFALVLVSVGTILTSLAVFCGITMLFGDDPIAVGYAEYFAPPFLLFGVVLLGGGIALARALKQTAPKRVTQDFPP